MIFNQTAVDKLKIGGYMNQTHNFLATDTPKKCFDKKAFSAYPHSISYEFNELGYRERSTNQYEQDAIIVIGDSAVTGVGLPLNLTFPKKLESMCGYQVLNFSLLGASNDWIARKLETVLDYFVPRAIVVHYTFSHRREKNEPNWFDNERTLCEPMFTEEENYDNWHTAHKRIVALTCNLPTVFSFIPNWHTSQVVFDNELIEFTQIDRARDGFHYGHLTSELLAKLCAERINQL